MPEQSFSDNLNIKIEKIIAITLKDSGVKFEYEPNEFKVQYGIVPDFRILTGNNTFYIEHLGRMDNPTYRKRWYKKLEKYRIAGIYGRLITTSEGKESIDQEAVLKKIIEDARKGELVSTASSYSDHHYVL